MLALQTTMAWHQCLLSIVPQVGAKNQPSAGKPTSFKPEMVPKCAFTSLAQSHSLSIISLPGLVVFYLAANLIAIISRHVNGLLLLIRQPSSVGSRHHNSPGILMAQSIFVVVLAIGCGRITTTRWWFCLFACLSVYLSIRWAWICFVLCGKFVSNYLSFNLNAPTAIPLLASNINLSAWEIITFAHRTIWVQES